jgi:hypothetical protein
MSSEFDGKLHGPENRSSVNAVEGDAENHARENEFDPDPPEAREPNKPPRGLMRKRRHPIVWIGLALLLGGLIAFVLASLVTG